VSDREGRFSFEDLPEDPDAAFIDALLGPRPEPREMTPEQSERLDRQFYAMVEEQRRAFARRRWRRRLIAGSAVAAVTVAAGAGLVLARHSPGRTWAASALMKARVPASAAPSVPAPHDAESVNGVGVPRK
jgi:hypothetical protein